MDNSIQRLNEITARLIAEEKESKRDPGTAAACHAKLDELEVLFFGSPLHPTVETGNNKGENNDSDKDKASHEVRRFAARAAERPTSPNQLVSEPEQRQLLRRVSKAVQELRCRHEELKHIHDLSILQAERAAQRILTLEAEVKELEADLGAWQSAHGFLKVQLKALEAQALPYIPAGDEEGLLEGLEIWKLDWKDVDGRIKARQKLRDDTKQSSLLEQGTK